MPLPIRQPREDLCATREASWNRLDLPQRLAWRAFGLIEGQVNVRETWRKNKDDKARQFAVLDGGFVDTVLREWMGLALDLVPAVWEGVRLLHDLTWQDGHESARLCVHPEKPLALAPGLVAEGGRRACPRCEERFRCETCWTPNEWHSHA